MKQLEIERAQFRIVRRIAHYNDWLYGPLKERDIGKPVYVAQKSWLRWKDLPMMDIKVEDAERALAAHIKAETLKQIELAQNPSGVVAYATLTDGFDRLYKD